MTVPPLYNHPLLKDRRRELRRNQTDAEKILWRSLRNRQVSSFKFFRQYSIGPYILDFFCPNLRLAIELDGGHHDEEEVREYDLQRTEFLMTQDVRVMRFWNTEILDNLDGVLEKIAVVGTHNPS